MSKSFSYLLFCSLGTLVLSCSQNTDNNQDLTQQKLKQDQDSLYQAVEDKKKQKSNEEMDERVKEMNRSVFLKVITYSHKQFTVPFESEKTQGEFTFKVLATNKTNKSVRAFSGVVNFYDLIGFNSEDGNALYQLDILCQDVIPAHKSRVLYFNFFAPSPKAREGLMLVMTRRQNNMRINYFLNELLFVDGQKIKMFDF